MKFASFRNQKGFSLVELMIVVGIIGILATLALPRFKQFQAKAKMGEAKNILSHIYTLEQTYSLDNNAYLSVPAIGANLTTLAQNNVCGQSANAQLIGFRVDPCQNNAPIPRYQYAVVAAGGDFVATAVTGTANNNRVCPHPQNTAHYFAINEGNVIWGAGGAAPAAATAAPTGSEPSVGLVCAN
jgi:prepilin-type N-terminal cleavage/methylation domain-containing protein